MKINRENERWKTRKEGGLIYQKKKKKWVDFSCVLLFVIKTIGQLY